MIKKPMVEIVVSCLICDYNVALPHFKEANPLKK